MSGLKNERKTLKKDAVPSIFPSTKGEQPKTKRSLRYEDRSDTSAKNNLPSVAIQTKTSEYIPTTAIYREKVLPKEFVNMISDTSSNDSIDNIGKSETVPRRKFAHDKSGGQFPEPIKHRPRRTKNEINDFDKCSIRQTIHYYYAVKNELPTSDKLLTEIKENLGFVCQHEYLMKILEQIGYRYKQCTGNHKALLEKPKISAQRESYLKLIIDNRNLPNDIQKDIIYIDESYIDSNLEMNKCVRSIQPGDVTKVSMENKWIIIEAGNEKGFVPDALVIYNHGHKVNRFNFKHWVIERLIPNIKYPSIIVMDSAPHHCAIINKPPTSKNKTNDIKTWLYNNNIKFDAALRKPTLLQIVKRNKPDPIYEIDEIFKRHGHLVARIPPKHSDLNPFELLWPLTQQNIYTRETGNIEEKVKNALGRITLKEWDMCFERVKKIERDYYERGAVLYEAIDEIVTQMESDSSDDSSSDNDDEIRQEIKCNSMSLLSHRSVDNRDINSTEEYLDFDLLK